VLALTTKPQARTALLQGLADTADLLALTSASSPAPDQRTRDTVTRINRIAREIISEARRELSGGGPAALGNVASELGETLSSAPDDDATRDAFDEIAFWARAVTESAAAVEGSSAVPADALTVLARRASAIAAGMKFDFLYDRRRRIFSIGYRLADADGPGRLDGAFYDLLASEARLASFVAIAKGDVPQHHWFHLGRMATNVDGHATLLSWGGTMFEYLMPQLLLRSYPGTLLDQSCRASVRRQIEYGRERRVPWGISECAYALTDRSGNYQYKAFGVPGLGLKRGLAEDLVVAPYATALAGLIDPAAAASNFVRSV